ncbi:carboxyl transferase domain-containing protein [Nocardioides convexus]|uniref:carboxyl transferase domain-containing protein n=1 Tax=Nocardioides convexus TaxID=2712224 RepID=UPI0024189E7E|nr:carboxyl transferase domain-containing protein [Nocardioides convexus]
MTAFARIDGLAVGVLANQSTCLAGAITADASTKAADFLDLCERWRLPVLSLVDTPGFMVGPEAERTGLVREASRMVTAGARLSVPLVGVVLRRGYGLGAQAMLGGSTHRPLLTIAWPDAHLGPMGLEGAVRLAMAHEPGRDARGRARGGGRGAHRRTARSRQGAQRRAGLRDRRRGGPRRDASAGRGNDPPLGLSGPKVPRPRGQWSVPEAGPERLA